MDISGFVQHIEFEKRFSAHTLEAYRVDLEQLAEFLSLHFAPWAWSDLCTAHIRAWMADMSEKGLEPASIRRKLSSLKSFYRYWRKINPELTDPTKAIQTPKLKKRVLVTADATSMARLMASFPVASSFPDIRDKFILELLYGAGLRRSELLALAPADVSLAEMRVKVTGKGGKERLIPFGKPLAETAEAYLHLRQVHFPEAEVLILTDQGNVPYPKWLYNKVRQYLGTLPHLERASPHVLRHSFATHLSDAGADLNAIKELLGHSSLAATQVYTHNSIEKLKRSYEQAHPKATL